MHPIARTRASDLAARADAYVSAATAALPKRIGGSMGLTVGRICAGGGYGQSLLTTVDGAIKDLKAARRLIATIQKESGYFDA